MNANQTASKPSPMATGWIEIELYIGASLVSGTDATYLGTEKIYGTKREFENLKQWYEAPHGYIGKTSFTECPPPENGREGYDVDAMKKGIWTIQEYFSSSFDGTVMSLGKKEVQGTYREYLNWEKLSPNTSRGCWFSMGEFKPTEPTLDDILNDKDEKTNESVADTPDNPKEPDEPDR